MSWGEKKLIIGKGGERGAKEDGGGSRKKERET